MSYFSKQMLMLQMLNDCPFHKFGIYRIVLTQTVIYCLLCSSLCSLENTGGKGYLILGEEKKCSGEIIRGTWRLVEKSVIHSEAYRLTHQKYKSLSDTKPC